jgi:hypothetical protein
MPSSEQIEKLLSKLTELTEKGKVAWQETANLNTFLAPVGEFVVTMSRSGSELNGRYSFQIMDSRGRTVDGTLAEFASATGEDQLSRQNWERLGRLHALAQRSALRSDNAVSELLSSLEQIR